MQVTKYLHSCLLVEDAGKKFLFDPGNYTAEANALNLDQIDQLDYLLITHEHQDHMYIPLIKMILSKFPSLLIITNHSAKEILAKEGINASTEPTDLIKVEPVPHEKVFGGEPPANILFKINDFTDPGDSFHLNTSTRVLALPIQAPWGSLTQAVELAVSLKPEVVLPIHDWHWNDMARVAFYKRLENYFANMGIKFIALKTAEKVTV